MSGEEFESECREVSAGLREGSAEDRVHAMERLKRLGGRRTSTAGIDEARGRSALGSSGAFAAAREAVAREEGAHERPLTLAALHAAWHFSMHDRAWPCDELVRSGLLVAVCDAVLAGPLADGAEGDMFTLLWNCFVDPKAAQLVKRTVADILVREEVMRLALCDYVPGGRAGSAFNTLALVVNDFSSEDFVRDAALRLIPKAGKVASCGESSSFDFGSALDVLSAPVQCSLHSVEAVRHVEDANRLLARFDDAPWSVCLFLERVLDVLRTDDAGGRRHVRLVLERFNQGMLWKTLVRGMAHEDSHVCGLACSALTSFVYASEGIGPATHSAGAVRALLAIVQGERDRRSWRARRFEERGCGPKRRLVRAELVRRRCEECALQALDNIRIGSLWGTALLILDGMAHLRAMELLLQVIETKEDRFAALSAMFFASCVVARWLESRGNAEHLEWENADRDFGVERKRDFTRTVRTRMFPRMFGDWKPCPLTSGV